MEAAGLAIERLDGRDHAATIAGGGEHVGTGDGVGLRW